MSNIILHQYQESPFSEKVRAMLAYKQLSFEKVDIPTIMPKPDLMALTGGYRRTPVMQVGADVYCDTALIAHLLEQDYPQPPLLNPDNAAITVAAARWTDSVFFRMCVGLVFQPAAIAANPRFSDPKVAKAFIADRAELTAGAASLAMPLPAAESGFRTHLNALDSSLAQTRFLGGQTPSLLDFSTWHCCWFVHRQPVLQDYFSPYRNVAGWLGRMRELSETASAANLDSERAVELAKAASPRDLRENPVHEKSGFASGDIVQVLPTDYGFQPVRGKLVALDDHIISLERRDPRADTVHVHFPRYEFEVSHSGENS